MADLDAAAQALGLPPDLVRRSAQARAEATGQSLEDILAAWSGGQSVAAPVTASPAEPSTSPAETPAGTSAERPAESPAAPAPELIIPATPAAAVPMTADSGKPPVLVGVKDNPMTVVYGAVILFVAVALLGFVGPSIPTEHPGARSSEFAYSADALAGQDLYSSLGCASCHTQAIRPIVADVGLGPVSLNDTNQVLGDRRHGPDLAEIGSRMSATQIELTITGSSGHPGHSLGSADMADLVAYLVESASQGGES